MPEPKETKYERKMRNEYTLYNAELDLWDSTRTRKLNEEQAMKEIMERLKI